MRLSILIISVISVWAKTTERFEAIYPLLKKVALAPGCNAMEEIFELSLKLLVVEGIVTNKLNPSLISAPKYSCINVLLLLQEILF